MKFTACQRFLTTPPIYRRQQHTNYTTMCQQSERRSRLMMRLLIDRRQLTKQRKNSKVVPYTSVAAHHPAVEPEFVWKGLGSPRVNMAGTKLGPNTASKTDGGQFEGDRSSVEVVYGGSDQDSDSGDKKWRLNTAHTAGTFSHLTLRNKSLFSPIQR